MYIANGIDVNATWADHIAVSTNGSNWITIPKVGLQVNQLFGPGGLYRYTNRTKIYLISNGETALEFECQNVSNGAGIGQHTTWQAGTQAALTIAHNEIMSWL